jgi:hypothetical protein
MWTYAPRPEPGCFVTQVHRVCPHNEVEALMKRVLAPRPPEVERSTSEAYTKAFSRLASLSRSYDGGRWSLEETALSYTGAMRRKYVEAWKSLLDRPLDVDRDSRLDCFLKAEKVSPLDKWPKPRTIFPRSARYNLALASRLKPFEHWLWPRLTAERMRLPGVGRLCAKGLNLSQRASLIERKMIRHPCVVEVDGSAFEAHVGTPCLKLESSVYQAAHPGDKTLRKLLLAQRSLRGRMPCGARFSRQGGRASGDFNTGMGNSLVMVALVMSVMEGFDSWDCLVDGDNALLFVSVSDMECLKEVVGPRALAACGQELTVERPVTVLEEVVFGRSSPVRVDGRPVLVRPWKRVISNVFSSHAWLHEPGFRKEFLVGVARCEAHLARGVPIISAYMHSFLRFAGPTQVREHLAFRDYEFMGVRPERAPEYIEPSDDTRASFALAFGVDPDEQRRLEREFFSRSWPSVEGPFEPHDGQVDPAYSEPVFG